MKPDEAPKPSFDSGTLSQAQNHVGDDFPTRGGPHHASLGPVVLSCDEP